MDHRFDAPYISDLAYEVTRICHKHGNDPGRLLDILLSTQSQHQYISAEATDLIAAQLGIPQGHVASVASFYSFLSYSFLSEKPSGHVVIRLCNDIVDRMHGADKVAQAFEQELGIQIGETTADRNITLKRTSCIGMSDQAPAALVNDTVVTRLSPNIARQIIAALKRNPNPRALVTQLGDGNNGDKLVNAMVTNNIRQAGPAILSDQPNDEALWKAISMSPAEVIRNVKTARLRGRGGGGFPTGIKWEFARAAQAEKRYIVCNADEGEPGTFKDRVILTERPDLVFEGMTIGGYAIGASEGILYLRSEYAYLKPFLDSVLNERYQKGLLGARACGRECFEFNIRIQLGAGAYICGEETALLNSAEGLRGEPRTRPPFPAQKGYLGFPTSINNVETFCCVSRIMANGPGWFSRMGSRGSTGTKLLSISGDCINPGVYEVPFGIKIRRLLELAGAQEAIAVQVGGPSGTMVGPQEYERTICYDDLSTGGAIVIFGPDRDLLDVVDAYVEFFVDESCGYCSPCRIGTVLLKNCIKKIINGKARSTDIEYLKNLGQTVKRMSRCGLGQSAPNSVLNSLERFPAIYQSRVGTSQQSLLPDFDLAAAVADAAQIAGR